MMKIRKTQTVCEWQNVEPEIPSKDSIIGLAIDSLGDGVLHGLRHKPENGTNGWYIWCGEYSDADDFFKPICIQHLLNYLETDLTEYLQLPPGYRFLVDGNDYEDVWYDESL